MFKAYLSQPFKDSKAVKCLACNHYCHIQEGNNGICGIRKNVNGELILLTYKYPYAVNLDPIEKKPFFHFKPGKEVFSLGTYGCNFHCLFCQNWSMSQGKKHQEVAEDIKANCREWKAQDIVNYCKKNAVRIIAYTYNEPTIFVEYAYEVMKLASKEGIKNVFVSNGYESKETLELISPYLDAINIDLKAFTEEFYTKVCGAHLQPVLENIQGIYRKRIWLEITTLLIPDKNDSEEELENIASFIASVDKNIPWHISRFLPHYKMQDIAATPLLSLEKAYQIGKKHGLNYVYLGNVWNTGGKEDTYCPNCNALLINREKFSIQIMELLEKGKCLNCQAKIPGVW